MLIDIIEVKPLPAYKLFLVFEDGTRGEVDITQIIPFKGVFAKLVDKDFFNSVKINPELGTICWKNGVTLAPSALYDTIKH